MLCIRIPTTSCTAATSTASTLRLLVLWSVIEVAQVNSPRIPSDILRHSIWMTLKLVGLQIHLRVEHHKLLLLTFLIEAWEVVSGEVLLKSFVIHKVGWSLTSGATIAKMTALVPFSAMDEELIISVEALTTKAALRMTLEAALVNSARVVVAKLLVFSQLLLCE